MKKLPYRQYLLGLIIGLAMMLVFLVVSLWLALYDNWGYIPIYVFAPLTIVVVIRIAYLVWFEEYD